jgi:hypothetical protein
MSIIFPILLAVGSLTLSNSDISNHSLKLPKSCLKVEDFNSIASYIENNGTQLNEVEGIPIDKGSLVNEIILSTIIIYDKSKEDRMSPTRVIIENNKVRISAYYSEIETEQTLIIKRKVWCDLFSAIK